MASKAEHVRISFGFTEESYARLDALCSITDSNYEQVVSNALSLYEASVKEMEAGGKVIIRRADGSEVEAF